MTRREMELEALRKRSQKKQKRKPVVVVTTTVEPAAAPKQKRWRILGRLGSREADS